MGKIAVLFPGQGSQYVGMGQDIYQNLQQSKQIFDLADKSLNYKLSDLCFNGPEEDLKKTEITQPAMLTVCMALYEALKEKEITVKATAGLSLGEYCSLVAAGIISFEEAVVLVQKRGKYMQEAVPFGVGTMAAIIGLDADAINNICQQVEGVVEVANYNCPGQIVIGGEIESVEKACKLCLEKGAKKAVRLAVSAPFHTSMLQPAKELLAEELTKVNINKATMPVVSSVTGDFISNKTVIRDLLALQVCSSVQWEKAMRTLLNEGFDTFIEVGPGKTLRSFMRRIDKKAKVINVYNIETLNKAIETLEAN
ncbi:ACP S-malonyltransferase [Clostridium sp. 'deep sea']|uniref:ACP S-malonyltransferase n=1 Tax=Clostridium sp. 'deep sea' TaxID=2779445 RepID=UPI0018967366|nr:ACP S-malonyltransferase [Clostridium sp. 'deep sea']QOR34628.1 ACP S-malonyltransferase [Clostridium sp. 'deep sea']